MRLYYLWIEGFRNLKNFDIYFNNNSALNMIIGENGSGKTNFLTALVRIQRDILINRLIENGNRAAKFNYKIIYVNEGSLVGVSKQDKRLSYFKLEDASEDLLNNPLQLFEESSPVAREIIEEDLPKKVFATYSGNSRGFNSTITAFNKEFKNTDIKFEMLSANVNIPMLTLACFSDQIKEENNSTNIAYKRLLPVIGADALANFSVKFNEESNHPLIQLFKEVRDSRDEKYDDDDEKIKKNRDGYLFYERFGTSELYRVLKKRKISSVDFFEMYFSLDKKVDDVIINMKFHINNKKISYNDLSEGEKQYLLHTALTNLYRSEKVLLMFDEPDTFLHPNWQRGFSKDIVDLNMKGTTVYTTHSPFAISNLKKESISIFKNGIAIQPRLDTFNSEIAEILEINMEVEKRNPDILKKIKEFYRFYYEREFEKAKEVYNKLQSLLGEEDGFLLEAAMLLGE